jgi:hypothetical protein
VKNVQSGTIFVLVSRITFMGIYVFFCFSSAMRAVSMLLDPKYLNADIMQMAKILIENNELDSFYEYNS